MTHMLVAYGTRQGHTAAIAGRIAESLRASHIDVDTVDVRDSSWPQSPQRYDAVVVGASVHARGYEREVRDWVRDHADGLNSVPSWFFSVSLTSANHDAKSVAAIDDIVDSFKAETGWKPLRVEKFAGALLYSKYNWFLRRAMRWIVRRESNGDYTDMSRDYDLTDYEQVDRFARDITTEVGQWTPRRV